MIARPIKEIAADIREDVKGCGEFWRDAEDALKLADEIEASLANTLRAINAHALEILRATGEYKEGV